MYKIFSKFVELFFFICSELVQEFTIQLDTYIILQNL
jgi:hypothetical protein